MPRVPEALTRLDSFPWRCVLPTRYGDQDPNGHVNNVALASLFEEARYRFAMAIGRDVGDISIVAAKLTIDFLAEAFHPLDITMGVGFSRLGRTSWTIMASAFDGERCLAVCEAVMVGVGPSGPMEMPPAWRAKAEGYVVVS